MLFQKALLIQQTGKTKDDETVTGTITIPEVAHDTAEDEYVVRSLSSNLCCSLRVGIGGLHCRCGG